MTVYKETADSREKLDVILSRLRAKHFEQTVDEPTLQVWENPENEESVELTLMFEV